MRRTIVSFLMRQKKKHNRLHLFESLAEDVSTIVEGVGLCRLAAESSFGVAFVTTLPWILAILEPAIR